MREAAQIAHGALVSQVGKQLAPHLRSIMPSWVMGMVDPHPAASSAALKALQVRLNIFLLFIRLMSDACCNSCPRTFEHFPPNTHKDHK